MAELVVPTALEVAREQLEPTLGLGELMMTLIPGLYISYSFLLMLFRDWAAFSQLGQLGESQIELRRFTWN